MSDNDLASKLARGMRRAKQPTPPDTHAAAPVAASSSVARERALADEAPATAGTYNRPSRPAERFADQTDQVPPASLDQPWENLHPKRIWPD